MLSSIDIFFYLKYKIRLLIMMKELIFMPNIRKKITFLLLAFFCMKKDSTALARQDTTAPVVTIETASIVSENVKDLAGQHELYGDRADKGEELRIIPVDGWPQITEICSNTTLAVITIGLGLISYTLIKKCQGHEGVGKAAHNPNKYQGIDEDIVNLTHPKENLILQDVLRPMNSNSGNGADGIDEEPEEKTSENIGKFIDDPNHPLRKSAPQYITTRHVENKFTQNHIEKLTGDQINDLNTFIRRAILSEDKFELSHEQLKSIDYASLKEMNSAVCDHEIHEKYIKHLPASAILYLLETKDIKCLKKDQFKCITKEQVQELIATLPDKNTFNSYANIKYLSDEVKESVEHILKSAQGSFLEQVEESLTDDPLFKKQDSPKVSNEEDENLEEVKESVEHILKSSQESLFEQDEKPTSESLPDKPLFKKQDSRELLNEEDKNLEENKAQEKEPSTDRAPSFPPPAPEKKIPPYCDNKRGRFLDNFAPYDVSKKVMSLEKKLEMFSKAQEDQKDAIKSDIKRDLEKLTYEHISRIERKYLIIMKKEFILNNNIEKWIRNVACIWGFLSDTFLFDFFNSIARYIIPEHVENPSFGKEHVEELLKNNLRGGKNRIHHLSIDTIKTLFSKTNIGWKIQPEQISRIFHSLEKDQARKLVKLPLMIEWMEENFTETEQGETLSNIIKEKKEEEEQKKCVMRKKPLLP